jgi:multisubunit Na+/H+ antiporter MnhG subunit
MTIAIELLIYVAVVVTFLSAWLMLRMKDEFQMMHFLSPPASVSAILVTIAIFLQQGRKPVSFKALFIVAVLLAMNTVVTHATARAFRIRQTREFLELQEGQEVPVLPGDEVIKPGSEEG